MGLASPIYNRPIYYKYGFDINPQTFALRFVGCKIRYAAPQSTDSKSLCQSVPIIYGMTGWPEW